MAIESGDRVIFELREDGAHLRVLKPTRLTDLYRSLPATRPYPGTGEIRIEGGDDTLRGIELARRERVDLGDAFLAVDASSHGETVCTLDRSHFERLPVRWIEP